MSPDVIRLGIGLAILIVVNIVLGSVDALLSGEFDKRKFWRGVCKGVIVALCFVATYLVGWLNPDVLAVTINGQSANLLTAVYLVIMSGFLFYAQEVIRKLVAFVSGKLDVGELTVSDTTTEDYSKQVPPLAPGAPIGPFDF